MEELALRWPRSGCFEIIILVAKNNILSHSNEMISISHNTNNSMQCQVPMFLQFSKH